jgi:hypothetical protein
MVYLWGVFVIAILLTPAWPIGFQTAAPFVSTVPVSLAIRATLLLALGTFALAYAALIQAVSMERDRRHRVSPGLEVNAAVSPASVGTPMPAKERAVYSPPGGSIAPYLANHGPGIAYHLRVRFAIGLTSRAHLVPFAESPLFSERYLDYDLREDPVPLATGALRQIPVFEAVEAAGHKIVFNTADPEVVTHILIECRCLNLEGQPGDSAYIGLVRALPKSLSTADPNPAPSSPTRGLDWWEVMESADVEFHLRSLKISMRWATAKPQRIRRAPAPTK